jgi:hypothetical protein
MKLRGLTIFALMLALGAVVAWIWLARDGAPAGSPTAPEASHSTVTPGNARTMEAPVAAVAPEPQTPALPPPTPVPQISSVAPGMPMVRTTPAPSQPVVAALPADSRPPASRPEPQSEAKADLEGVQFMLRDFRTRLGENPVGSNAEIMRAVMGGNEAKAHLGPPPGQQINEQGELLDRWGTPYFFHQLSKTSMEIRSAGPDGRLWTADDVVTK